MRRRQRACRSLEVLAVMWRVIACRADYIAARRRAGW